MSGPAEYVVGDQSFKGFGITTELAVEAITEAGMSDITFEKLTDTPGMAGRICTLIFFRGMKREASQEG